MKTCRSLQIPPHETDLAAPYPGEEHGVLMQSTEPQQAKQFTHQINANVEVGAIEHNYSAEADVIRVIINVAS